MASAAAAGVAAADTDDNTTPTTTISNRGFDLVGFTLALDNLTFLVTYLVLQSFVSCSPPQEETQTYREPYSCWRLVPSPAVHCPPPLT